MQGVIEAQHDIEILKNLVTEVQITYFTDNTMTVGEDMSAYTAQAQAKESDDPAAAEICTFTIDETNKATGIFIVRFNDKTGIITQAAGVKGFWNLVLIDASNDPFSYVKGYAEVVQRPTTVVP